MQIFGDFCVDGNLTLLLDSTMFNANDKQIDMITGLMRDQSQWLSDSGHVINNLIDCLSRIPIMIFGASFHQSFAPRGVLVLLPSKCLTLLFHNDLDL